MRINRPLVVTLLALSSLAACMRVDVAAEEAAIRARGEALVKLESAKNAEAATAFYTDDAIAQAPGAPLAAGKAAVKALYDQFFSDTTFRGITSTTTSVVVAASGDLAYEHGVNRMTFSVGGTEMVDVGKYLVTWRKMSGEWMVAGLAFSSDAPPPMPPVVMPMTMPSKTATKTPAKKPM